VILLDACKSMLRYGPGSSVNVYPWTDLVDLRESYEISRKARDPALLGRIALGRVFPSVRDRHEVRDFVARSLRSEESPVRSVCLSILRNWNRNRDGGTLMLGIAPFNDPPPKPAPGGGGPWTPDPVNAAYLRKFLDLAEAHRIRVVWFLLPHSPRTQAGDEASGDEARYESFVREHQRRRPGLAVVDARRIDFGVSRFRDTDHLNRDGASAMSAIASDALRGLLDPAATATSAWVVPPATPPPAGETPSEDLDQSWIAVKTVLDRIRRR
jgi:hypothetical protein